MQSKIIHRNPLGRVAKLGCVYDGGTDNLVDFLALLEDSNCTNLKQVIEIPVTKINFLEATNLEETFEVMDIGTELGISILSNLAEQIGGHAKFIHREKIMNKWSETTLIYTIQTQIEKLQIEKENAHKLISKDALNPDLGGTHIITEVFWGTKLIVTIEQTKCSHSEKEILTELIEGNQHFDCHDDLQVQLFSDVFVIGPLPTTVKTLNDYLPKLQNLVKMGKGKPIGYTLMSCDEIYCLLDSELAVKEISVVCLDKESVKMVYDVFDKVAEIKLQINHLCDSIDKHNYCIPDVINGKFMTVRKKILKLEKKIQKELKDLVFEIRSGNQNADIIKKLKEKLKFELLSKTFQDYFKKQNCWLEKIEFIKYIQAKGAPYVGRNRKSFFDIEQMKSCSSRFYILFFGIKLKQEDLWMKTKQYFINLINKTLTNDVCITFMAVDMDVRPELGLKQLNDEKPRICFFQNGVYTNTDVYQSYLNDISKSYVKFYNHESWEKPAKRVDLRLSCPISFTGKCSSKKRKWYCTICDTKIAFAYDDYFYCLCGRAHSGNFSFKCSDEKHGELFASYPLEEMESELKQIPPMKELNILIIGITGVGKSTFVNAFINYLVYSTLEEASQAELVSVTSSQFTLEDENDFVHVISLGHDENEVHKGGQSSTQDVRAHLFPIGNTLLRLIDTPGVGDIRGVQKDKENFQKIIAYLSTREKLHGICILLKPNEARLNILFEFCIKELLTNLHKSASKNIVFCLTHSRGNFYKPGDTRTSLEELLKSNKIDLPLEKQVLYCVDNESFRFLCAKNQGVHFGIKTCKSYSESWNWSVKEINRMILYFNKLVPHKTEDTKSLNDVRTNIIKLMKPIADIERTIQMNLNHFSEQHKIFNTTVKHGEELKKILNVNKIKLICKPLGHRRTVCGSAKCVRYHKIDEGFAWDTEYITHCHDRCHLEDIPMDIIGGDALLKNCHVMNSVTQNCDFCGCFWDQHLHIDYEQEHEVETILRSDVDEKLLRQEDECNFIMEQINQLEMIKEEEERELVKIMQVSFKFGRYLNSNALLPVNDVIGKYIDHLIEKEEDNRDRMLGENTFVNRLKEMRKYYTEENRALKETMDAHWLRNTISKGEFQKLLEELYGLKRNGKQLRDFFEHVMNENFRLENFSREILHNPKCGLNNYEGSFLFDSCYANLEMEKEERREVVVGNQDGEYGNDDETDCNEEFSVLTLMQNLIF